jgi:hypothetical protein
MNLGWIAGFMSKLMNNEGKTQVVGTARVLPLGRRAGYMVLAGLAPSSQTVGYLFRVIHEQAKRSS